MLIQGYSGSAGNWPRRITFVYQQLDLGGRQIALLGLARELQQRGWQVDVVSFLPGELEQRFRDSGIHTHVLTPGPKVLRIVKLWSLMRRIRPDIVHTHLFSAGFWGRIAARLAGVPVVVHTEGGMLFEDKKWKRVPAERLLTRITDRVICVAEAIKNHMVNFGGIRPEALMVIPNGIAAGELLGRPLHSIPAQPVLFSAGRLAHIKGYDLLIRALAQLHDVEVKLTLAGDGPERHTLERLAEELGVADRVTFLGYRTDVRTLLAECDIYVTPSRSEGLSNSILEAMAAGVPVVATDVGGNRELLGDTGYLVEPDSVTALSRAIAMAVSDPETSRSMAGRARNRVRAVYSLEQVVDAHETLYLGCLTRKGLQAA